MVGVAITVQLFVDMLFLGFVQQFKGEGMPIFNSADTHGDLYVEYNVVLPLEIPSEMRRSKLNSVAFLSCKTDTLPLLELSEAFNSPSSTRDEL